MTSDKSFVRPASPSAIAQADQVRARPRKRLALSQEARAYFGMESPWWYAPHNPQDKPERPKPAPARKPHEAGHGRK